MHLLFTRANNLDLPLDLQLKLFDNTVLPILTYGSEVWGYEGLDILERVYTDFLRRITRCRKSTPKYMFYAELGRHPIEITIKLRMINFWTRLITGKISKLSYNMYIFMLKSEQINSKWIHCIRNILNNSGRYDAWLRQFTSVNLSLGKAIKQNLLDQFLQSWNSQLHNSSQGRNYSLFKNDLKQEKYIINLDGSLLYTRVRFRTANHKLPIETGRWNNIDLPERKCELCNKNDLGDEYHYLLRCSFFVSERRTYIDPYFYTSSNILKFKELLQISDHEKLVRLGKFMRLIMLKFQ